MGASNSTIDGSGDGNFQNSNASKPGIDGTLENVKNPHKFDEIVKKADYCTLDDLNLKNQARTDGIFLDQKKKKYWVDEKGHNCFMLFARDLSIVWGEDERYFRWISENESDTQVEAAELKKVCWLEIRGKFEASLLNPNIKYQVLFDIKIKNSNFGWSSRPVKLQLKLSNQDPQKNQEKLDIKPKERWIQIKAGEFETRDVEGDIEIGLFEWDNPNWKGGLIIKGITIRPVY